MSSGVSRSPSDSDQMSLQRSHSPTYAPSEVDNQDQEVKNSPCKSQKISAPPPSPAMTSDNCDGTCVENESCAIVLLFEAIENGNYNDFMQRCKDLFKLQSEMKENGTNNIYVNQIYKRNNSAAINVANTQKVVCLCECKLKTTFVYYGDSLDPITTVTPDEAYVLHNGPVRFNEKFIGATLQFGTCFRYNEKDNSYYLKEDDRLYLSYFKVLQNYTSRRDIMHICFNGKNHIKNQEHAIILDNQAKSQAEHAFTTYKTKGYSSVILYIEGDNREVELEDFAPFTKAAWLFIQFCVQKHIQLRILFIKSETQKVSYNFYRGWYDALIELSPVLTMQFTYFCLCGTSESNWKMLLKYHLCEYMYFVGTEFLDSNKDEYRFKISPDGEITTTSGYGQLLALRNKELPLRFTPKAQIISYVKQDLRIDVV